jgi:hypothetical protein
MSDHLEMDMVISPFLRENHIHSLIEFSFLLLDGAVAILRNQDSLLSFPRKPEAGDHIRQDLIVLDDNDARFVQASFKFMIYPFRLRYHTCGK